MESLLEDIVKESILEYFRQQTIILLVIFIAYLILIIMVTLVFTLGVYQEMKKIMLQSNRLLYIIDFESLTDLERQRILRFLT